MAVQESLFPNLAGTGYRITSPPDSTYNCIAWAASVTSDWWWPDPDGFDFWPSGIVRECTVDAFILAFATCGFTPCSDGSLEPGWERVAIYATHEGPTHMARQLANDQWTSKLGPDDDIEHTLDGLVSPIYGSIVQFLRRPVVRP
jgi:hypothetical protein